MKPENLKYPFSRETKRVLIQDRVWFVPGDTPLDTFTFPGWTDPGVFSSKQPIKLEYCSGNGAWIAAKAIQEPLSNWVAIERKFTRVRKIWSKLRNLDLNNLLIICGEGEGVTEHYFPARSVSEIFINFPDPWPKRRHARNRIIQSSFIQELSRILQVNGIITFVTDDPQFSDWSIRLFRQAKELESCYPEPYYLNEFPDYGTSFFEDLWREKGKQIRYHQFRKKSL